MTRRYDLRRIKAHLSYTAAELARTIKVNIRTVRRWKAEGLLPIEGTYPQLFDPVDIIAFLRLKNKPRQPLQPGEIFCVACKKARRPAHNIVDLAPRTATSADLIGDCPVCRRHMYRRVTLSKLAEDGGALNVRYEDETAPIGSDRDAPRIASLEEAAS